MSSAPFFSFFVEPHRDLVRITLAGFFTPADVAAFVKARNAAYAQLTCSPGQHVTLTDVTEMKVQPQDAVAAFSDMLAAPEHRSRRLAFVVASTLARSQMTRVAASRAARFFTDEAEAEAWLFEAEQETPVQRTAA